MDLEANDQQLDFPILYGIARQGIVVRDPEELRDIHVENNDVKIKKSAKGMNGLDITPLFDTIINHVDPYPDYNDEPLQLQISALAYDDYIGRLRHRQGHKGSGEGRKHRRCSQGRRIDRTAEDKSGVRVQGPQEDGCRQGRIRGHSRGIRHR